MPPLPPELVAALRAAGLVTTEQQMAYLNSMMQPAVDPYLAMGMGANPDDPSKAFTLGNKGVDYQRDVNSLVADPMSRAFTGIDAFGGPVLGEQMFQPTIERKYIDAPPDYSLLTNAGRSSDPIQKWVFSMIMDGGANEAEIAVQLETAARKAVAGQSTGNELADKAGQSLVSRGKKDQFSDEITWDFSDITGIAEEMRKLKGSLPPDAVWQDEKGQWQIDEPEPMYDPTTGRYFIEEETPSPASEWFAEKSLFTPDQQYTLSDFTPEGAQYQEQAAALRDLMQERDQSSFYGDLDKGVSDAYARYQEMSNAPLGPETQPTRVPTPRGAGTPFVRPGDRQYGPPDLPIGDPRRQARVEPSEGGSSSFIGGMFGSVKDVFDEPFDAIGNQVSGIADIYTNPRSGLVPTTSRPQSWEQFGATARERGGGPDTVPGRAGSDRSDPMPEFAPRDMQLAQRRAAFNALRSAQDERRRNSRGNLLLNAIGAEDRAQGYRVYGKQADGKWGYDPEQGVAQGNLDYQLARATGRTPLADQLAAIQRAMGRQTLGY